MRRPGKIYIGRANAIKAQLRATNVDTGGLTNMTAAQMQDITKMALTLPGGAIIATGDTGVALGAGNEFDHTVDLTNAIVSISIGRVEAVMSLAGVYRKPYLDVYFSSVDSGNTPIIFPMFEIQIIEV